MSLSSPEAGLDSGLEFLDAPAAAPAVEMPELSAEQYDGESADQPEDASVHEDTFSRQPLGTVFMGPNPLLEASLSSFSGHSAAKVWDEKTEAEYMGRVRERAVAKAAEILSEARVEAERLHQQAKEEGYAQGLAESKAEVESFRAELGASVGAVIEAIEGQSSNIFDRYRSDLVDLTKLAVEKVLSTELSSDRAAGIDNLFKQAMEKLENRTSITVKVSPDDEAIVSDLVASAQLKYPDLKVWNVRADSSVTPGGLLLESQDSLIDNRIESRKEIIRNVLDSLELEASIV